jgi:hypothetical protein
MGRTYREESMMKRSLLVLLVVLALLCTHASLASAADKKNEFPCDSIPSANHTQATSVHSLKPSHIRVTLAIGDSVTTAFGIHGAKGFLNEFRGESWSIGKCFTSPTAGRKERI